MKPVFAKAMAAKKEAASMRYPMTSREALERAKDEPDLPDLDWRDGHVHPCLAIASFEHDDLTFDVRIEYDDLPDLSHIGWFGQRWKPGCVDLKVADYGHYYNPHLNRYFYPAFEYYRNLNWGEMKRILDDEVFPCCVRVVASKNGIFLADSAIWGCFYEPGKEDEVAGYYLSDLIFEAKEWALDALAGLCS